MRLSIRTKIILPFAVLLLFVGIVGTGVTTARFTDAASAAFDAGLLRASLEANQWLSQVDAARASDLREVTATIGVPEALDGGDINGLATLIMPIAAISTAHTDISISALDIHGAEVLRIQGTVNGPLREAITDRTAYAAVPPVAKAVTSAQSSLGDLGVFLSGQGSAVRLYWVGPAKLIGGRTVGAVMVGESLATIDGGIPGSVLYSQSGLPLASTLASRPTLADVVRRQVEVNNTVALDSAIATHQYRSLFSEWVMRGTRLGFIAVQASADPLQALLTQVRLILTIVFTVAALLTLIVGTLTASLLTRPLKSLVRSMQMVSLGDLRHRAAVASKDEIGYLARTFNEMTASLEDKTAALEETTFASMETLARAIDARDPSTYGHSSRVAALSLEIADGMGLSEKDREALRRSALLHDIGKIGVEDRVLRKPGPLSEAERGDMQAHSRIGYDMLKGLRFLEPSLPGVLHHHERWDGGGYPSRLKGAAIPLLVRILAVADVFDALTSDRPYRDAVAIDEAFGAIQRDAGCHFDPEVVAAFVARRAAIATILAQSARIAAHAHSVTVRPEAA